MIGVLKEMCFQLVTKAYTDKETPSFPSRRRTYHLPITSLHVLPLSYRRLVRGRPLN